MTETSGAQLAQAFAFGALLGSLWGSFTVGLYARRAMKDERDRTKAWEQHSKDYLGEVARRDRALCALTVPVMLRHMYIGDRYEVIIGTFAGRLNGTIQLTDAHVTECIDHDGKAVPDDEGRIGPVTEHMGLDLRYVSDIRMLI